MVIYPRALVGVVKPAGIPVELERTWSLGINAWLRLQIRYFIFHGPCRLILKGCRAVLVDKPEPGIARVVNQGTTIGFSANLAYSVARTETFRPYFFGEEPLLNDLFEGGPGCFIYEGIPSREGHSGVAGRWIEGAWDAALKLVGI